MDRNVKLLLTVLIHRWANRWRKFRTLTKWGFWVDLSSNFFDCILRKCLRLTMRLTTWNWRKVKKFICSYRRVWEPRGSQTDSWDTTLHFRPLNTDSVNLLTYLVFCFLKLRSTIFLDKTRMLMTVRSNAAAINPSWRRRPSVQWCCHVVAVC